MFYLKRNANKFKTRTIKGKAFCFVIARYVLAYREFALVNIKIYIYKKKKIYEGAAEECVGSVKYQSSTVSQC